jgi:serine/threonine protein kinase/tetratricopeptide (TPR) repeat protein
MECPGCKSPISDDSHFCRLCGFVIRPGLGSNESTRRFHPGHQLTRGSSFLGRYRIVEELGRGGMGIVYKAEDTKLRRNVALKFLPPEYTRNAEAKERFVHEAQAASSLEHPNICSIHEIEETSDGQMYISMGCYDGETLQKIIREGPVDIGQAVDFGIQVAQGLQEAHDKGIVHRDIKPSNIIVTSKGRAKVMDFGLAKLVGQTRITKAGTAMGTISYMSPEQARGEDVDTRTDIWSLGVVLYELVTGQLPFKGEYDQAVIYSILNEEPRPISELTSKIPQGFGDIISRCLEKDSTSRYQSAADLEADLGRWREESGLSRPSRYGGAYPKRSSLRSLLKIGVPAAIALAVLLVALNPAGRKAIKDLFGIGAPPARMRVALLPCEIGSENDDQKAFCDGLILTLTNHIEAMESPPEGFSVVPAEAIRDSRSITLTDARVNHDANVVMHGAFEWIGGKIGLTMARTDVDAEIDNGREVEVLKQRGSVRLADPIANLSTWQDTLVARVFRLLDIDTGGGSITAMSNEHTSIPAAFDSFLRGQGYLYPYDDDRETDRAIDQFRDAVTADPSYELAVLGLGEAYSAKFRDTRDRQWADSSRVWGQRALELDDRSAEAVYLIASGYHSLKDYEPAIEHYIAALELDPTMVDIYANLSNLYMTIDSLDRAAEVCLLAIEMDSGNYHMHSHLAYIYYKQGKYRKAIDPCRQMVALRPDKKRGYDYLGAIYGQLEMWPEATEMFERSFAIDSTYSPVISNLGTLYFNQERYADAERIYRRALRISDRKYKIWAHLAEAQYWNPDGREESLGNFTRAAEMAEDSLRMDQHNTVILSDLASYYEKLGYDDRAREFLDRAISLNPQDIDVMLHIGETYEGLGERDIALDWIARALEAGGSPSRVERYPGLSQLRVDPRYEELIEG